MTQKRLKKKANQVTNIASGSKPRQTKNTHRPKKPSFTKGPPTTEQTISYSQCLVTVNNDL